MPEEYAKPLPVPDEESQPFFDAAREGRLLIMRCKSCGAYRYPSRDRCDVCWSTETAWVQASGRGTVYTFGIMHQLYHPGFKEEIPYNVAVVELEEGPRTYTNLVGIPNDQIRVGMPVEVVFEKLTDEITIPKFKPAS